MILLHHTSEWLPGTMTWLRQLIQDTESAVDTHILTEKIHPGAPHHARLRSAREERPIRFWASKAMKRLGWSEANRTELAIAASIGPDLLHSHFGHIGAQDLALVRHLGVPHVVSFYGMDVHQLPYSEAKWLPLYRRMFASGATILCEGEFMRSSIIELGASPEQVRVHRLGVDVGRIRFRPERDIASGTLDVLMASAFRPKKGILFGLEAVRKAAKSIPIRLTLVGDAADEISQQEKSRIEDWLNTRADGLEVRRHGFLKPAELQSLAEAHHVYLAPSVTAEDGDCEGGAPVGLIEAAAAGMLIVSTRHCDIPGVVDHDRTGWLSEERDTDAMAANLIRAWEARHAWGPIQVALRQHIEARFHHRIQGEALVSIYHELGGRA